MVYYWSFNCMRSSVFAVLILLLFAIPGVALAQTIQVDEVVIEGNRRVDLSAVRSVLSVKAGQEIAVEEVDRDIRAIFKLGRFADVAADIEERGGLNVLVFRLTERPLVRAVEYAGNKEFSTERLSGLVTLKTPDIYDPRKIENSISAIRKAYLEEGFHAAEIVSKVDVNEDHEATVTFEIKEGDKVLIRQIRFEGNTVFTDVQLIKVMETKKRWFLSWLTGRGTYNEEVLQNDLEIIADQYYNKGYVQVKVRQPLITIAEDKKGMNVLIEIREGEQFRVGGLDIDGDLLRSKEEILALTKLKPGDVFSRQMLRQDVLTINDLYADQGYAYVNVSPLTQIDADLRLINILFEIEQGVQVHIDRIQIAGNTRTRDKVIRREMKLAEGDLFSSTKIKESRRRINNLGFFEEVNVATGKASDEAEMNVNVDVIERPTGTFSVGLGYSSVDGVIGQGSITQENFLGRALKLNLAAALGGKSTTYQLGLTEPYFLDKNLTLGFDLYKTERDYVDFSKRAFGGNAKLGFPLTDDTRAFFLYKYEEKEIFDVDSDASSLIRDQEGKSTLSSITGTLTRNTTDYYLDPTRGSVSQLSAEFAGLGGTEKFAKYIADQRFFFPYKWGTVFSLHGQIGYIQSIGGEDIPIDERFYLGGINTIRGFKSRQVGPRVRVNRQVVDSVGNVTVADDEFEFIGGDKQAYFNLEYTFPLLKDMGLKGVLFFDTGNAWSEDENYFSEMRYSVGGGVRWFSPMGPLRLEWGYNLKPREGEDRSQFEFSIGRFF
jgi:outer membrane protein insertion porin family